MQCAVDACLDPALLDHIAPRAEPEDSTEVCQGCRDQDQTREMMTELVQVPQQPKFHKELAEAEVSYRPSDDTIKANNSAPDNHQNVQQLSQCEDSSPAPDFSLREPKSITHQFLLDVCSPFADDEEEETKLGSSKSWPYSHSNYQTLSVIPLGGQQRELLYQGQHEPNPKGANQEAAQQVLDQNSAPLSGVAMEPPNRGGAASKGSACVVKVRERKADSAGERTEGESKPGEQYHTVPGGNKVIGREQSEALVKSYEFIQIQEEEKEQKDSAECPKLLKMESDSSDDSQSDSGLSADFSPRSTSNISQGTHPKETPIEREIRRAIEREHSLRRSRGLPNASQEYVMIPQMKTLPNQAVTAKSDKFQGIDRELAGKMMQHEIHEDVGREQDLVKLGKVPGFYDKGTVRQLKEKKQLFEAFQNHRDSSVSVSSGSSSSSSSSSESQDEISSQVSNLRSSDRRKGIEPLRGADMCSTARGPGLSEGNSCQVMIVENKPGAPVQNRHRINAEVDGLISVHQEASYVLPSCSGRYPLELKTEIMSPKENPFFKLRSLPNGVKVEQDIREAQEREKELLKQRISVYGGGGGGERPVSMDRRSLQVSSLDLSSASSCEHSRHTAARQSVGKLSMWPPGQDHGDTVNRQNVVQASHSSRHKTPLVHLWESGLVNGHNPHEQ